MTKMGDLWICIGRYGAEVTQLPIGFYPYNQILRHKSVTKNSKRSIDGEKFLIHSLVKKF